MTTPHDSSIHHRALSALPAELLPLPRAELLGLAGSSGAYLAAGLLAAGEPRLAVLAPDSPTAQTFCEALDFFHGRPGEVGYFPGWELDPYSPLSPHPEVEAQRLATLTALADGRLRAVVTTVRAVQQRLIPRSVLEAMHLVLQAGTEYPRSELLAKLMALGYQRVPLVEERGTFAVRGDLVDLFPPTSALPVRLAFFGDELEELRPFEALTQRTGSARLPSLELSPAREMILSGEHLATYCARVRARCDELELPRSVREALLTEAREGLLAPGREQLLALNYPALDTFFDHLGKVRWLVLDPPATASAADDLAALVQAGERRQQERGEAYVPAADFYLTPQELDTQLGHNMRLDLAVLQVYRLNADYPSFRIPVQGNGDLRPDHQAHDGTLGFLVKRLRDWHDDGWRVLLVCHQQGQGERLRDLLEPSGLPLRWLPELSAVTGVLPGLAVTVGGISAGFRLDEEKLAVISDDEIFGPRSHRKVRRRDRQVFESTLADLRPGHHVVHVDYGIARYHGLLHLQAGGTEGDFLHLEFAGDDRLYLPVERIEKVQKYVADGGEPRLDKMGSGSWEKAKLKARAAVEELARDLLHVQAKRQLAEGFRYTPPDRLYREFEAAFPYEETPDQLEAIEAVLNDLQSGKPVDRLICGDVGYGKTEVAIRAAFKVVLDGRQVAVLVPTTVLARQHLETFRQRLADFPVTVEMLSRFRTPTEQKNILAQAAEGRIDILIGTHRLLQSDVRFKNLGLVVVDEEQRFGVAHKERLKKLRAEVDLLTLTATPIPRTLHLSLTGIRDLSIIDTPPVDRQAIRTYVTRFDDDLVRDAILRELKRGGQVYFVHNRVQTIDAMAEFLRTLVPTVRIGVGHGQMNESVLENAMLDFIEGRTELLLCTAIIENGLDIARANTIIIDRADTFGLAQLYQLRGRVGRSHVRAYAYLLIPGEGSLTHDARERLKVLQEQTELGAGFRIARHDLELRGAGDLLGARQAGQIAAIGFELYTELLEETVKELQGQVHEARIDPEVRLGLSAYLPESYVADPNQRLVLYRRLAAAVEDDELYVAGDELRDRFGELPEAAQQLLEVMRLRVLMKRLRIDLAEYDGHQLVFSFPPTTRVTPEQIMALLARPERYRFSPDFRLSIRLGRYPASEVLDMAKKELRALCAAC